MSPDPPGTPDPPDPPDPPGTSGTSGRPGTSGTRPGGRHRRPARRPPGPRWSWLVWVLLIGLFLWAALVADPS